MPATSNISPAAEIISLAKTGNRSLAEHRLRALLRSETALRNPEIWIWMAWLAPSPAAMSQILDQAAEDSPHFAAAQAGKAWANALSDVDNARLEIESVSDATEITAERSHFGSTEKLTDSLLHLIQDDFGTPLNETRGADARGADEQLESTQDLFEEPSAANEALSSSASAAADNSNLENQLFDTYPTHSEDSSTVSSEVIAEHSDQEDAESTTAEARGAGPEIGSLTSKQISKEDAQASNGAARGVGTKISDRLSTGLTPGLSTEDTGDSSEQQVKNELREKAKTYLGNSQGTTNKNERPVNPAKGRAQRATNKILVVDDSPTVRKLLTMMLTQGGYDVTAAVDGVDAAKHIASDPPNLIITDINMPRLDGYKLCKLVTRNERTKHIPVVMISAGMIDSLRGKLVGCRTFLTKPITPEALMSVVESQLPSIAKS